MNLQNETVYTLAVKCSNRQLPPPEFLNLYKEFYNEKFAKTLDNEDVENVYDNSTSKINGESMNEQNEADVATTTKVEDIKNENGKEEDKAIQLSQKRKKLMDILSDDFVKIMNCDQPLLLADYIIEILFINYDNDLVHSFMPKLTTIKSTSMLVHFFARTCIHFDGLKDKIVIDQLNKDLSTVILPNILNGGILSNSNINNRLVIAVAKFLYSILKFSSTAILIQPTPYKDNLNHLMSQLYKINRLLYKKISLTVETKLMFKESDSDVLKGHRLSQGSFLHPHSQQQSLPLDSINSPSITSPQFISSPMANMKTPMTNLTTHPSSSNRYTDMKLIRYYKNIWLNSKIMNWEVFNSDFLSKYNSISLYVPHNPAASISPQNNETILTDLIETSFICFAQYVSNKQYHRSNTNLNLLERQWIIFITKHLPLLILKHCPDNPQITVNALESIDTKVIKAIKSYYSEKEDNKNRNDDLFDDFSATSFDIRHDFIKSLVMLGLQPPSLINEFLREDQLIDPKTLQTTDEVIITTPQGSQEPLSNIPNFLLNSLDSIDLETIGNFNNETVTGIQQILNGFENIAPTKQREISLAIINIMKEAIDRCDHAKISKLCSLLVFNFSHSLTFILSFSSPKNVTEMVMKFVDTLWDESAKLKKEDGEDSEETNELSLSFTWALLFLLSIHKNYNISLPNVVLTSSFLKIEDSFSIRFLSKIAEIPDDFSINEENKQNPEVQTQSHKLVQGWLSDLFINGSLSDQLTQNTDTKQLAILLPFILKQVFCAIEMDVITDINMAISGFEYFLQPFMIIGLMKIMFWLEQYLTYLNNDSASKELLQKVFAIINSLVNPSTLNEDSRTFHNAVLRINAVPLLTVLRKFKDRQSQPNYGVYSSDSQERSILDLLIEKFTNVLNISPIENVDPRVFSTDTMYSQQKPISYGKLMILNENSTNKIMTNQINSFWNLHSSTYYNLDFLNEVIDLVTPKNFLFDVLETLDYKLATYGVPAARNKMGTVESEHVLDYFLYFLVLHDCESQWDATNMINLLTDDPADKDISNNKEETLKNEDLTAKPEPIPDDDFDMLFGENETSSHGVNDDVPPINMDVEDNSKKITDFYALKRDSFGIIFYELKPLKDIAYKNNELSQEDYNRFNKIYDKYVNMLKTCVF